MVFYHELAQAVQELPRLHHVKDLKKGAEYCCCTSPPTPSLPWLLPARLCSSHQCSHFT
ncbi:hypothetical protein GBAR_LOCUS5677, partial [Geodia barretti]